MNFLVDLYFLALFPPYISDFIMSHNGESSSFTCHRMVDCKGGAANTCPWDVPYLPSIAKIPEFAFVQKETMHVLQLMRGRKLQQAAPLLQTFLPMP